jgi:ATP-binding cassette subfamily F protein uup
VPRPAARVEASPPPKPAAPRAGPAPKAKLTFREAREIEALPAEIEALEAEQHALTQRMCAPGYHRQPPDALRADRERAEAIEHLLAQKFERWAALDAKAGR